MKISVPVTITVEVEFDMTPEEAASYLDGDDLGLVNLKHSTTKAIQDALHADPDLADDMVERITDNTGWCLCAISMVAH